MIIEIHYHGKVVGEMDIPEVMTVKGLRLSARLESKMNLEEYKPEPIPDWKTKKMYSGMFGPEEKKKKLVRDKPRFTFPDREIKPIERAKAEYSNPAF